MEGKKGGKSANKPKADEGNNPERSGNTGESSDTEDLKVAAEQLMAESGWLERRRPILTRLIALTGVGKATDATQFRALNLILELMEKAENETKEAFQPTEESIREAIEILKKFVA